MANQDIAAKVAACDAWLRQRAAERGPQNVAAAELVAGPIADTLRHMRAEGMEWEAIAALLAESPLGLRLSPSTVRSYAYPRRPAGAGDRAKPKTLGHAGTGTDSNAAMAKPANKAVAAPAQKPVRAEPQKPTTAPAQAATATAPGELVVIGGVTLKRPSLAKPLEDWQDESKW